jgi:hypothetical protein
MTTGTQTTQTQQPAGFVITMTVVKDNNSEQSDKAIVIKKPERAMSHDGIAAKAKANTGKLCGCRNSEPGKIKLDIRAHEPRCHIRKRLQTGRYATYTFVTPGEITGGYSLSVAIGREL